MMCSSSFREIRQDLSLDGDAQTMGTGFLELLRVPGGPGVEQRINRQLGKRKPQLGFPKHSGILGLAAFDLSEPWCVFIF